MELELDGVAGMYSVDTFTCALAFCGSDPPRGGVWGLAPIKNTTLSLPKIPVFAAPSILSKDWATPGIARDDNTLI